MAFYNGWEGDSVKVQVMGGPRSTVKSSPLSQIPGIGDCATATPRDAPRKQPLREDDTEYLRLARQGGHSNLLSQYPMMDFKAEAEVVRQNLAGKKTSKVAFEEAASLRNGVRVEGEGDEDNAENGTRGGSVRDPDANLTMGQYEFDEEVHHRDDYHTREQRLASDPPRSRDEQLYRANGAMSNGPMSNGPMSNGPMSNGPMSNGPMSNGPMTNGPMINGSMSRGPVLHSSDYDRLKQFGNNSDRLTYDEALRMQDLSLDDQHQQQRPSQHDRPAAGMSSAAISRQRNAQQLPSAMMSQQNILGQRQINHVSNNNNNNSSSAVIDSRKSNNADDSEQRHQECLQNKKRQTDGSEIFRLLSFDYLNDNRERKSSSAVSRTSAGLTSGNERLNTNLTDGVTQEKMSAESLPPKSSQNPVLQEKQQSFGRLKPSVEGKPEFFNACPTANKSYRIEDTRVNGTNRNDQNSVQRTSRNVTAGAGGMDAASALRQRPLEPQGRATSQPRSGRQQKEPSYQRKKSDAEFSAKSGNSALIRRQ